MPLYFITNRTINNDVSVSIHVAISQYLRVFFLLTRICEMSEFGETAETGIIERDTSSTFCSGPCCCFCRANLDVRGRSFIWRLCKHRFAANKHSPSDTSVRTLKYSKSFRILQRIINVRHLLPRNARLSSPDGSSPLRSH